MLRVGVGTSVLVPTYTRSGWYYGRSFAIGPKSWSGFRGIYQAKSHCILLQTLSTTSVHTNRAVVPHNGHCAALFPQCFGSKLYCVVVNIARIFSKE